MSGERVVKRKQRKVRQEKPKKGVSRESGDRGANRKGCKEKGCLKKKRLKGGIPSGPPLLYHKLPAVYITNNIAEQKVYF